jgi:hypothetical protein
MSDDGKAKPDTAAAAAADAKAPTAPTTAASPAAPAASIEAEIVVTGFGEFHGIKDNPTSHLMEALPAAIAEAKDWPAGLAVSGYRVCEVSRKGCREVWPDIAPTANLPAKRVLYVRPS